jgi:hypothetical protein
MASVCFQNIRLGPTLLAGAALGTAAAGRELLKQRRTADPVDKAAVWRHFGYGFGAGAGVSAAAQGVMVGGEGAEASIASHVGCRLRDGLDGLLGRRRALIGGGLDMRLLMPRPQEMERLVDDAFAHPDRVRASVEALIRSRPDAIWVPNDSLDALINTCTRSIVDSTQASIAAGMLDAERRQLARLIFSELFDAITRIFE